MSVKSRRSREGSRLVLAAEDGIDEHAVGVIPSSWPGTTIDEHAVGVIPSSGPGATIDRLAPWLLVAYGAVAFAVLVFRHGQDLWFTGGDFTVFAGPGTTDVFLISGTRSVSGSRSPW